MLYLDELDDSVEFSFQLRPTIEAQVKTPPSWVYAHYAPRRIMSVLCRTSLCAQDVSFGATYWDNAAGEWMMIE